MSFRLSQDKTGRNKSERVFPESDNCTLCGRTVRIVLAEDEAITALHVEFLLTGLGYEVCDMATSGPEVVTATATHRPDLVLMDIRLADGTDGVAAAAEIGERFGTPVVYLTAHTDPATVRRAQATHPLGFITKPYSPEQLAIGLRNAVARLRGQGDRRS